MYPQILSILMLKQNHEAQTKGDFHVKPGEWWDAVENKGQAVWWATCDQVTEDWGSVPFT